MTIFYMFQFEGRKVFPCECHWYDCYHSISQISKDLKQKPVILLKHCEINSFNKISEESSNGQHTTKTSKNLCRRLDEETFCLDEQKQQQQNNKENYCLSADNIFPFVDKVNLIEDKQYSQVLIVKHKSDFADERVNEESVPSTCFNSNASTCVSLVEKESSNCMQNNLIEEHPRTAVTFQIESSNVRISETEEASDTKQCYKITSDKYTLENGDTDDLPIEIKDNEIGRNTVEIQSKTTKTYVTKSNQYASEKDISKHGFTLSPCKVALSSCFNNVIKWNILNDYKTKEYSRNKTRKVINERSSMKKKRDQSCDRQQCENVSQCCQQSDKCSESLSSSSSSSNHRLSNHKNHHRKKRLFEAIDNENEINHYRKNRGQIIPNRYSSSYFDDYANNHCDLLLNRPKKRKRTSYDKIKKEINSNKLIETGICIPQSKDEDMIKMNLTLSPCKVMIERLDYEKVDSINEYSNSEIEALVEGYNTLEYKGRLRRSPKQRSSYESDWIRKPYHKKKKLFKKQLKKKNTLELKRQKFKSYEIFSIKKSLDFINRRFINQNSLRSLLLLESLKS